MDNAISRAEHEEFRRSMELANENLASENRRQNRRLDILEENAKQNTAMVANVERLAVNMENMLKVQEQQGDRLEALESRDGEKWRSAAGYVLTVVLGIVIGFVFKQIGM
ncbi:MAG: hypothetical protein HFI16_04110 [Lachnospiraceae bacterium]|nr:hypothetical protein [Lachnospiraceae bacterium]